MFKNKTVKKVLLFMWLANGILVRSLEDVKTGDVKAWAKNCDCEIAFDVSVKENNDLFTKGIDSCLKDFASKVGAVKSDEPSAFTEGVRFVWLYLVDQGYIECLHVGTFTDQFVPLIVSIFNLEDVKTIVEKY